MPFLWSQFQEGIVHEKPEGGRRLTRTVTLSAEEHAKLLELHRHARTTPYLVFGQHGENTADSAWDGVRRYMDELGRKYGYDPKTARISMGSPTFEVD